MNHGELRALAAFLRTQADPIARRAARVASRGLPVGSGARRSIAGELSARVRELGRLLEQHGEDGLRIYGEAFRPHARRRLAQGVPLDDAIEELEILFEAMIDVRLLMTGTVDPIAARVLGAAFTESASQTADVWLRRTRSQGAAFRDAALLETLVNHLDEAILVIEADGTLSWASPAARHLLGVPPSILVGLTPETMPTLIERLHVRDLAGAPVTADRLPSVRVLRERKPVREEAFRIARRSGEAIVEVLAIPVLEDGELRGAIVTIRDRTERHQHVIALERANDELRQMHARLLGRSRMEAVGEVAASAAHALNNELNAMNLRLRRVEGEDGRALQRSVRAIADVVARLQELAVPREPGRPVEVRSDEVVREAVALTRAAADEPELRVEEPLPVLADRQALLELLASLILSAREATPAGLRVQVELRGRSIAVRDRGPGLDRAALATLEDPLVGPLAERGLSLAVARKAVRAWGGELTVSPAEGGGTRFTISLRAPEAEPRAAPAAVRSAAARARRVLVVDDDQDNAEMLSDLLRDEGALPFPVATGGEALARLDEVRPDAALVDLLLPDMKGWEVVRALKSRDPSVRVAVVSGLSAGREPEGRLADAFFRKPVEPPALLAFLGL